MNCRLILVALCFVVVTTITLHGLESQPVVLKTGTTIDNATAKLQDGMVWLTFKDGHMQAYALEDVDLKASGLLPDTASTSKDDEQPVRRHALADATTAQRDSSATSFTITDADVEHIQPDSADESDGEEEEGQDASDQSGPLIVTNLIHSISGGRVKVKGVVTNNSDEVQDNVMVAVVTKGTDGSIVGNGRTRLDRPLKPRQRVSFTLMLIGDQNFVDIDARAQSSARSAPAAAGLKVSRPARGDEKPDE